jgi:PhnB protein
MHDKDSTTVNPYLTFSGNCREAMTFYKEALNGELEVMTFEGAPVEIPDEFKNNVMHASLRFGLLLLWLRIASQDKM